MRLIRCFRRYDRLFAPASRAKPCSSGGAMQRCTATDLHASVLAQRTEDGPRLPQRGLRGATGSQQAAIADLQRRHGNAYVQRLLRSPAHPSENPATQHDSSINAVSRMQGRGSSSERIAATDRGLSPMHIHRRLIVSGSTEALVNEYLTVVGTAGGLRLNWTFAQPRVAIAGNRPGAVPSGSARSDLQTVINHPTQHAELHVGTNQPRVSVGAFPERAARFRPSTSTTSGT